jgi:ATPase subunit of ABC transporter with duplicated ATPase domains
MLSLNIENLSKRAESGEYLFKKLYLRFNKGEKIAVLSRNALAVTALLNILSGEDTDFEGSFQYGQTISTQYLPNDNSAYFSGDQDMSLMDWLRQYSKGKRRRLYPRVPRPDVVRRRRGVQALGGVVRRRKSALHDVQDHARQPEFPDP